MPVAQTTLSSWGRTVIHQEDEANVWHDILARYAAFVGARARELYLKGERCLTNAPDRGRLRAGKPGRARRGARPQGLWLRDAVAREAESAQTYGVLERQFKRHFDEAARRPGKTSDNLIYRLEMRMDNIVYRLGFGDSRAQARQTRRAWAFPVERPQARHSVGHREAR